MRKTMKLRRDGEFVIPANAGIQGHDSGFRVALRAPGMTIREIVVRREAMP
jgi:hypothetical protein